MARFINWDNPNLIHPWKGKRYTLAHGIPKEGELGFDCSGGMEGETIFVNREEKYITLKTRYGFANVSFSEVKRMEVISNLRMIYIKMTKWVISKIPGAFEWVTY